MSLRECRRDDRAGSFAIPDLGNLLVESGIPGM